MKQALPGDKEPRGVILDGKTLRALRKSKGWTQEKLAKVAGWSVDTIRRAEAGTPVALQAASDTARALEVSLDRLIAADAYPDETPATSPIRRGGLLIEQLLNFITHLDLRKGLVLGGFIFGVVAAIALFRTTLLRSERFNPEADIGQFESLGEWLHYSRFIQLDCGMEALDAGGLERFKNQSPRARHFASELFFRDELTRPFLAGLVNALHQGRNLEDLRQQARAVADSFYPILAGEVPAAISEQLYAAALSELERQTLKLRTEGFGTEHARWQQVGQDWPQWCSNGTLHQLSFKDFLEILENGRSVYSFVAGLYRFAQEVPRAKLVMLRAKEKLPEDLNVNNSLAEYVSHDRPIGQYLDESDADRVHVLMEVAIKAVDNQTKRVAAFSGQDPIDLQIKEALGYRYRRAELDLKRELAFFWAQESYERDILWDVALDYAQLNFESYRSRNLATYPCIDDYIQISILDTYSYVKMVLQNYYKKKWNKFDEAEVKTAITYLNTAKRRLGPVDTSRCLGSAQRKKRWEQRILIHLRQAEEMLK
jgi:transcriptional regulator with XRE-family HTH domain